LLNATVTRPLNHAPLNHALRPLSRYMPEERDDRFHFGLAAARCHQQAQLSQHRPTDGK